jgi:competence protein ComEC
LLTFPLSLYYFHQFPNYFLFTNPIVAILSMLILPVGIFVILLFEVPFIGAFLAYIFKTLIGVLNYLVFFISDLKFATTTRLELGTYSVILLFIFIGLIIHFFTRRNKISLMGASVLVLILSVQKIYKTYEQNQSNELTFHYIPRGYGISILDQREANFISSKELIDDPLITQFHLKNYYDHMGVKAETRVSSENRSMLKISKENLKVQWVLDQNAISDLDLTADYLMISNDAIRDLEILKDYKGQIIIDGSNKKWYIENLQEQNKNYNLNLISLYDSGSKTFKI